MARRSCAFICGSLLPCPLFGNIAVQPAAAADPTRWFGAAARPGNFTYNSSRSLNAAEISAPLNRSHKGFTVRIHENAWQVDGFALIHLLADHRLAPGPTADRGRRDARTRAQPIPRGIF